MSDEHEVHYLNNKHMPAPLKKLIHKIFIQNVKN